jgi:hypothetical protein
MTRPEAEGALGLKNFTVATVAAAGAIRYVKGPERNFPARCFFFLREDVMRIKQAFEQYSVPVKEYSHPGEFIALHHAMKNYLGRGLGLAAAVQAVVDGSLVPTGFTDRFRGITGYLFRSGDLRKYRPMVGVTASPEGSLSFNEAAFILEVRPNVIRGLADQGLLSVSKGFRNGFARLVPAEEVHQFAERYVATSVLSKRLQLARDSLARYLRETGTPLLAIRIPDTGRGCSFFLQKDVATQIRLPSREMLREASQNRIRADRKRKWAEYRQAREAALGKPIRRVRRFPRSGSISDHTSVSDAG